MIHMYIFKTTGKTNRDTHDRQFLLLMQIINQRANTNIVVDHTFAPEDENLKHWWKCQVSIFL